MKKENFNPTQLADMHSDGVHFDYRKNAGRFFDQRLQEARQIAIQSRM